MQLLVLHPEVASRSCSHCQKYLYNEETGAVKRQKHAKGEDGLGQPVPRPAGALPMCRIQAVGCPKGTPERQASLSAKNWLAVNHYYKCKATGKWPEDGIVMRNAGIIEAAFKQAEITQQWLTNKHRERLETLLARASTAAM